MINCRQVEKSYRLGDRDVPALRGVDLTIGEPGFYAIMGASGSGKSTLLHLLAGLDTPDKGELTVSGHPLHTMSERHLTTFRRESVGIVFQQFNLIPTMSASENVELPGMLAGRPRAWLNERSHALLERLGLNARARHRPDALSGGEQQRVAIARALLFEPPVLLADEPTGNLDSRSSASLWALLQEIAAEQEMTVVMVTHEPAAAAWCRSIAVLLDGRIRGHIETDGLDAGGIAAEYQRLSGQA